MHALIDFCDPGGQNAPLQLAFATPRQVLVAHTLEQVPEVLRQAEAFSRQGRWCVGYLRYEAAPAFDAALPVHAADGPLAWFGVHDTPLPWPTEHSANSDVSQPTTLQALTTPDRAAFDAAMQRMAQDIAAGAYYQVNYTQTLLGRFQGDPGTLFKRLRRAQPGGYCAYLDCGAEQLLSVSPELFFDWQPGTGAHGGTLLTRPMKGTAPRGTDPASDAARIQALQSSPKERAENVMIVDLLRNDVSRIAQPHSVQVPQLFTVQTLPTVFQMVSDVSARTRAGVRLADVFAALFPCGSVTGAPKVQAMRSIHALEPQPRGIYCGALGVLRPGGHATFNVPIRTVVLRGQHAQWGIGSGITADAQPAGEWQEWQHKQGFLERASSAFELLETLRWQDGQFQHLGAHLDRMAAAAAHFGYPWNPAQVEQALNQASQTWLTEACAPLPWRVRLLLNENGVPRLERTRLAELTAPVRLCLADHPFAQALSEFTRFKTTRRAHYDAFAPHDPTVFDTLLFNPRGELTECTRGNIALQIDGQWVTPAHTCGLLAGVGRAHALAQGRLREAVVRLDALAHVQAWAFLNSLRGWLPAELVQSGPEVGSDATFSQAPSGCQRDTHPGRSAAGIGRAMP